MSLSLVYRFSFLEKEVKTTFDVWDKEVGMMTEKLKQFTHVDIDTVPHVMVRECTIMVEHFSILMCVGCAYMHSCTMHFFGLQEKMCLLIMSLPASQLSIQPVMSAIEVLVIMIMHACPTTLMTLIFVTTLYQIVHSLCWSMY